jgi:hypothetical protein
VLVVSSNKFDDVISEMRGYIYGFVAKTHIDKPSGILGKEIFGRISLR